MRPIANVALATVLTGLVTLTTHFAVLFPQMPPEPEVAVTVAAETSVPESPMGPDYIAPPPVIPVS